MFDYTSSTSNPQRVVTSFVVRFVYEVEALEATPGLENGKIEGHKASNWRGVVTHVQSGVEQHFTDMSEAEAFMLKFIQP